MKILAIETSCDETAVAVLEIKERDGQARFRILSNIIASQIKIHSPFGGIVPNLAKREHQKKLVPALMKALGQSGLLKISKLKKTRTANREPRTLLKREPELLKQTLKFLEKYKKPKIDLIAVTQGPGLEPALWVGINFAKVLACVWNKPIIGVNHMEGHLFSVFLKKNRKDVFQVLSSKFQTPTIALLVSGGHTELVLMKDWLKYKIIGETRDDAAGEAFDKVARLLGLGYPGGPAIAAQAAMAGQKYKLRAASHKLILPRPMLNSKDYDFSFSGLKTAVLYSVLPELRPRFISPRQVSAIAAEFQQAVIDVLIAKTIRAAKEYKAKTIILAGGVAANKELRKQLKKTIQKQLPSAICHLPSTKFCGDNAAMIALAAYFHPVRNSVLQTSFKGPPQESFSFARQNFAQKNLGGQEVSNGVRQQKNPSRCSSGRIKAKGNLTF